MRSGKLREKEVTPFHGIALLILILGLTLGVVLMMAGIFGVPMPEENNAQTPPSSSVQQPLEKDIRQVQVLDDDVDSEGVVRFVDQSAGTVCYVYRDDANGVSVGGTGGLSCLPLNETSLSINDSGWMYRFYLINVVLLGCLIAFLLWLFILTILIYIQRIFMRM
jgi:hypothetical protein